jgi:hypothetical protein
VPILVICRVPKVSDAYWFCEGMHKDHFSKWKRLRIIKR